MSLICPFIKFYEEVVWDYLTDVFSFGLRAAELGVTNDLIYQIARFYRWYPSLGEVYAVHGRDEDLRGADVDLFIFDGLGYHHFMIQAKIMDCSGRYLDIKKHGSRAQFIKLIQAAKNEAAYPLYLLFNGNTPASTSGKRHHGCAIVPADTIRAFRWGQRKTLGKARTPRISFSDLSGSMKPFHYLFCPGCPIDFELPKKKSRAQIYTGFPYVNLSERITNTQGPESEFEDYSPDATAIIKERRLATYRIIVNDPTLNQTVELQG